MDTQKEKGVEMKPMTRLKKLKKKMDSLAGDEKDDEYWGLHEAMKFKLKELLNDQVSMLLMSKAEMLLFIRWCSSFRPKEPHVILMNIGALGDLDHEDIALLKMKDRWGTEGVKDISITNKTIRVVYEDGFRPFINRVVYFDRYMRIVKYEN